MKLVGFTFMLTFLVLPTSALIGANDLKIEDNHPGKISLRRYRANYREHISIEKNGKLKLTLSNNSKFGGGECPLEGGVYAKEIDLNIASKLIKQMNGAHFEKKAAARELRQLVDQIYPVLDKKNVMKMSAYLSEKKTVMVQLINVGESELNLSFPTDLNQLLYLDDLYTPIEYFSIKKIPNGYQLELFFKKFPNKSKLTLRLNNFLIAEKANNPPLSLCAVIMPLAK